MDFATLKQTWGPQSDLRMSNWDPFPELKGTDCWPNSVPKENFCNSSSPNSSCGIYNSLGTSYSANAAGKQPTVKYSYEAYEPNIRINPYAPLSYTWKKQQNYTL